MDATLSILSAKMSLFTFCNLRTIGEEFSLLDPDHDFSQKYSLIQNLENIIQKTQLRVIPTRSPAWKL